MATRDYCISNNTTLRLRGEEYYMSVGYENYRSKVGYIIKVSDFNSIIFRKAFFKAVLEDEGAKNAFVKTLEREGKFDIYDFNYLDPVFENSSGLNFVKAIALELDGGINEVTSPIPMGQVEDAAFNKWWNTEIKPTSIVFIKYDS